MLTEKACAYPRPETHEPGAILPAREFGVDNKAHSGLKSYCRECCRAKWAGYKRKSPTQTRMNGEPPRPMTEEDTTPGIPPASLVDGSPDFAIMENNIAERLLVISDMHAPRQHPQALEFLAAVKAGFSPDRVVSVGDESDFHGISFHDKDPNLPGPSDELRQAREFMAKLAAMFPALDIAESNHGSLPYRKALASGIPEEMIRTYNDILQVPKMWRWRPHITVQTKTGPVHIEHGEKATARMRSRHLGMSVIQGHRHPESYAEWWDNSLKPLFAVQAGCLIDRRDRGFAYGRQNQRHPVISVAVVIDGEPFVIRLNEKKSGMWDLRIALNAASG